MPTANTNNLFTDNLQVGSSPAAHLMSKYNLNNRTVSYPKKQAGGGQKKSRILVVGDQDQQVYANSEADAKRIQQKLASMPRPEQLAGQDNTSSPTDDSSDTNGRPLRNAYKAQKEAKFMEKYGHQALYDEALDASSPDEDAIEAQAKDYEEKMDMNKAGGTGADKRTPSHQRKPKSVRM